jgi:ferredoxin
VAAPIRLEIDLDLCTGHGRCYALAPDLFEPDDVGRGVVTVTGPVPEDLLEQARWAVGGCPEGAISAVES